MAFKVNSNDLFKILRVLRSKRITPLNIFDEETDNPTLIHSYPCFGLLRDSDGHLIEYLALINEEPKPNLRIVTWSEWTGQKKFRIYVFFT